MLICLIILVSSCQTIKKTSDVDKEEYNISKDIEEIKSKFFKNKPGLYFSLSKIDFDKNFTNKSIMIKNAIDERNVYKKDIDPIFFLPQAINLKKFKENILNKINNEEDKIILNNCYYLKNNFYYLNKKVSYEEYKAVSDILNKINYKMDYLNINDKDYWTMEMKNCDLITNKIKYDLILKGMNVNYEELKNDLIIVPSVNIFYIRTYGNMFWMSCFSLIKINFKIYKDKEIILNKTYYEIYNTDGTEEDYEGSVIDFIPSIIKTNSGVCLRRLLDRFYEDLKKIK